jgi:hypothetical protein
MLPVVGVGSLRHVAMRVGGGPSLAKDVFSAWLSLGCRISAYGQRKPNDPGAILTLRAGQEMKDLLLRLIPSAVIAGRILDEDGEPLAGASVAALREIYSHGKRSLSIANTAETNDLGEYRLYGLAPGRYFVSAALPQWNRFGGGEDSEVANASSQGYAKIYFPGTSDASKASSISVKAGEEIPSVEILMRQSSVYRIRGHVYNQITLTPGTGTMMILAPKTESHEWDAGLHQVDIRKQDGSFRFRLPRRGPRKPDQFFHAEKRRRRDISRRSGRRIESNRLFGLSSSDRNLSAASKRSAVGPHRLTTAVGARSARNHAAPLRWGRMRLCGRHLRADLDAPPDRGPRRHHRARKG